jgi:TRAP-type C4-dicarboxylate transport system permease small subunit
MLAALGRLTGVLLDVCKWASIVLVALIAVIVVLSVIFRYIFNDSLAWAEDASKFLLVWLAFLGAPLGFRHGAHVSIELLPSGLPEWLRRLIRACVHAIVLGLMLTLVWYGAQFAWNGRSQIALTIGDISMFWIFVCMPIGAAVMALVSLELLLTVLLGLPEPRVTDDEAISTQGM